MKIVFSTQIITLEEGDTMLKRYAFYLARWQLSTPILVVCITSFSFLGNFWATVIANFIGGLMFFWIDRKIFHHPKRAEGVVIRES
jgi:fructose-specific phosphotransferase system IIC component